MSFHDKKIYFLLCFIVIHETIAVYIFYWVFPVYCTVNVILHKNEVFIKRSSDKMYLFWKLNSMITIFCYIFTSHFISISIYIFFIIGKISPWPVRSTISSIHMNGKIYYSIIELLSKNDNCYKVVNRLIKVSMNLI